MATFNINYKTFNCKGMNNFINKQHFIGCDVSKATLDIAIYEQGVKYTNFKHSQFANDATGYKAIMKWLHGFKFKDPDIVIAMEHTGSYSVPFGEWLHKHKITFCMLHPTEVKNACSRGRNKTDKVDSQFIADHVYTMREKLSPSQPEPPVIKRLRELRSERDLAVKARTAYINHLKTKGLSTSKARINKMVSALDAQVKAIEKEIRETIKSDDAINKNYNLLLSVPGIGPINAVVTIIATGNFTRFQTSRQYAKFCCISPLANRSGKSINKGEHVSQTGHHELKTAITPAAKSAVLHYPELRDYYNRKIAEGKAYGCVMNAVKFKLLCRMFAVIKRGTEYADTNKHKQLPSKS
jgi:transposase